MKLPTILLLIYMIPVLIYAGVTVGDIVKKQNYKSKQKKHETN